MKVDASSYKSFDPALIAPCGINCGTCLAYLRAKNRCGGCRIPADPKPKHCVQCSILNCVHLAETTSGFCYDCVKYPCQRMKQLDKRYRKSYNMSLLENLNLIKELGINRYIVQENAKWRCPTCGGTICVHRGYCLSCSK
ncbi:MAG: DUF3795 domain-containing protein [Bacteroidales bacterium]|nr:DUF3795 domain-containing protein [Bacteroidales bacterium]